MAYAALAPNANTASMHDMASIKFHEGHKTAPILTAGNVSPTIIAQFIEYLESFFHKAKIADTEKVWSCLSCFQDLRIDNWIKNNRARFLSDTYTFADFTAELRKRFLDPHWESMIFRTIVNCQMSNTESFIEYANRVMQGNNLLIGTPSRLEPNELRSKLEVNMTGYLAERLAHLRPTDKDRIAAIDVFEDWYDEICVIDREANADLKRIADFAAEHIAKRQRTNAAQYPGSQPLPQCFTSHPALGANAVQSSNQNASQPQRNYRAARQYPRGNYRNQNDVRVVRCPRLLATKIELLDRHDGCRKCCRFYVRHRVPDCPNGFPDGRTYVTLTEAMALQAKNNTAIAST